jgi:LemA protein
VLAASSLYWLGLLAVLGLWMLGVYNRITALRAAILVAWAQVELALSARAQALSALLAAVAEPLSSETAAIEAVAAAQLHLLAATEALRRRPVAQDTAAALSKADAVLAATLVRLVSLVEQFAALSTEQAVMAPLAALRDLPPRLVFAQQMFNDAGSAYNAATQQLPTRLLGSLFRFGHAGRL